MPLAELVKLAGLTDEDLLAAVPEHAPITDEEIARAKAPAKVGKHPQLPRSTAALIRKAAKPLAEVRRAQLDRPERSRETLRRHSADAFATLNRPAAPLARVEHDKLRRIAEVEAALTPEDRADYVAFARRAQEAVELMDDAALDDVAHGRRSKS